MPSRTQRYSCSTCDYSFVCPSYLNKHMIKYTSKGKIEKCIYCGFKSCNWSGLMSHITKHHNYTPNSGWECIICNSVFSTFYRLQEHTKLNEDCLKFVKLTAAKFDDDGEASLTKNMKKLDEITSKNTDAPKRGNWVIFLERCDRFIRK